MKGSTFESFLDERGLKDEIFAIAAKRVLAYQISELMKASGLGKTAMALRMETSRPQLARLLDPLHDAVQLNLRRSWASASGSNRSISTTRR